MTDNTLKTNNTQQVEPEFRPLTKEEAEMLLEEAKNWKEPEYDDYDAYNTYETSCDVGFPPALKKKPSAEEYAKQIDKTGPDLNPDLIVLKPSLFPVSSI